MRTPAILLSLCLSVTAATGEEASCCKEEVAAAEAAGSIYQLDATWTNQHGEEVKLSGFKGMPVLLTMGFASCQNACPRLAADLMAIERELKEEERGRIRIVFVSIDPERDTPEALAAFLKERNVDQTRWFGLRGAEEDVQELSVATGTRYRKLEGNDFAHSNIITLLSETGEILHKQEGLGADMSEMIAALRKALGSGETEE